jgi:excisionase family DNA binding protein
MHTVENGRRELQADEPLVVSTAKAARMLGISVAKAYLLMAEGQLPFVKIGRSRRITVSAIKELIEQCTVKC